MSGQKCLECGAGWPNVSFVRGSDICERCRGAESVRGTALDRAIDEAQSNSGTFSLERRVSVNGIESKTNLIGFNYATHRGMQALVTTDVFVTFGKPDGDASIYSYKDVPVAVCEAWYAAPSKGSYFREFIRNSYPSEKVA